MGEKLVKAFPHGISAQLAATMLGFNNASELASWLRTELQLDKLGPTGRPLGAAGRLDCSVVGEYLQKALEAKAAKRAAEEDCGKSIPLQTSSFNSLAGHRLGEAPIWAQLNQGLKSFAAQHASVLEKMAAKKEEKKVMKKMKKQSKKEKKMAKKLKK